MTDREMLELAARAVGIRVVASVAEMHGCTDESTIYPGVMLAGVQNPWDPLTDDGDALRLKVNLHLIVGSYSTYSSVGGTYTTGNYTVPDEITVWHHETAGDACAAERLAITRAAAEIGRQMEVTK